MPGPDPAMMDAGSLYKAIEVINNLAVELDADVAFNSVRNCALDLLECERVTLFLLDEHRRELRGKTCDEAQTTIVMKFGEGIAGTVAQTGGLMNIADAYSHPLFNLAIDKMTRFLTRNILCCSIADISGNSVAVLQALNKKVGAFTPADEHVLQLFSVHMGNTLVKSRYYEEAKREKLRLATLNTCFKRLSAVTSLSAALDAVAEAARELVSARHVVVLLMDHARHVLWTSIANNSCIDEPALIFRVKQGQGVIARCAADKQQHNVCFVHNVNTDKTLAALFQLLSKGRSELSEVVLQPVIDVSTDKCLAVMCVINKEEQSDVCSSLLYDHSFSPSDCDALELFSMEVADLLAARSLEVSFASAMSVVAATGTTAAQEQVSNMLKAQLMDYAPLPLSSAGDLSRGNSCQLPQHTLNAFFYHQRSNSGSSCCPSVDENSCSGLRVCSSLGGNAEQKPQSSEPSISGLASPLVSPAPSPVPSPLSPLRSFRHNMPSLSGNLRSAASTVNLKSKYTNWELDCASMTPEELQQTAYDIFSLSGVFIELQLPQSELSGFLNAVVSQYHPEVPYHNLGHAVQVLHTVWMILETTHARTVLSSGEELVLLIAALCHDLDHDGRTNPYHINSQSELAQLYNDISVQENHHCALTSLILRQRGSNLLQCFTGEEWQKARRLLIDVILATDMHHHFTLTQELQKHSIIFATDDDADKVLLMKAILHAADISTPIRPFTSALASAERLHKEFQQQAQRERELNLPVAPHMDADEVAVWAKMEVQFIDYVAGPLWERMGQIFPTLQQPISTMKVNRAKFANMAQTSSDLTTRVADPKDDSNQVASSGITPKEHVAGSKPTGTAEGEQHNL